MKIRYKIFALKNSWFLYKEMVSMNEEIIEFLSKIKKENLVHISEIWNSFITVWYLED